MSEWNPGKIIGGIGVAGAAAAVVLWGVPYYIHSVVREDVKTEIEALPDEPHPAGIRNNTAQIEAIHSQLDGMEARMIERDRIAAERDAFFMQYLKDQAERNQ